MEEGGLGLKARSKGCGNGKIIGRHGLGIQLCAIIGIWLCQSGVNFQLYFMRCFVSWI